MDEAQQSYIQEWINKYYWHPERFMYDVLGVKELEPEQLKITTDIIHYSRMAIKSGHGIGKTAILAMIILWWLCTRIDCRIPMTSPSQHQLFDILMPEIIKWRNQNEQLKQMVEITATRVWISGYEKSWFGIARSCNKGENIAGFHSENLLIIIEEASGVEQEIIDALEGALTGKGNKMIMIGNPTRISGAFHAAFHQDRDLYKTYTFNAENSRLVSKDYIKRMARYGTDSDIYRVRVLGEFPKGDPDTFIRLDKVEDSINREVADWNHVAIGVDPARFGDDESTVVWRKGFVIQPIICFNGIDTVRLSGEIIKLAKEIYRSGYTQAIDVKVDDTGIGAGVTDQLNNKAEEERIKPADKIEFSINVVPVINNWKPSDPEYKDFGSQIWGHMKIALDTIRIPDDNVLCAQLSTRKYKIEPDGTIKMEQKKDMKKRKLPSPDRADALGLCLIEVNNFNFDNDEIIVGKEI